MHERMVLDQFEAVFHAWDNNQRKGTYIGKVYPFGNYRGGAVVILAEHKENTAMSITNNIEHAITAFTLIHRLDPFRCIWIEYYPGDTGPFKIREEDSYDMVQVSWDTSRRMVNMDYVNYLRSIQGNNPPTSLQKMKLEAHSPSWCRVSIEWLEMLLRTQVIPPTGVQ